MPHCLRNMSRFRAPLIGALMLLAVLPARGQIGIPPVVPLPKQVVLGGGWFRLDRENLDLRISLRDTVGFWTTLEDVYGLFHGAGVGKLSLSKKELPGVWLGIPGLDKGFERFCRAKGIWPAPQIGDQGYVLLIESEQILIAANTKVGLFYGVQTLKQLVRGGGRNHELQAMKIVDWPDLRYRGVFDDISRGPIPTNAYLKEQIRRAAEMKLNLFSHYVEHVVATKSHTDFAPPGAITIQEWKELADYAKSYHIELIGAFQSFGHFQQILSHPQYAHLGEGKGLLSPMLDDSYKFLGEIYAEMIPAFNAPFFNVQCDETFDLGKGASRQRVDSLGIGIVYAEHMNKLYELVKPYGVRMMMWADIALDHPEVLALIPRDVIMMPWNYDARESFSNLIEPLQKAGFDVLVTTGVLNSYSLMPDMRKAVGNIRQFAADAVKHNVMGLWNTVWDDGGTALFALDWYGVAYGADQGWHSNTTDTSYHWRFDRAIYDDRNQAIANAMGYFQQLADLTPTDGLNEKIFWVPLIPERGQSLRINMQDWEKVLEISEELERTLDSAAPTIFMSDIDAFKFVAARYRHMSESRNSLLEAAKRYREASFRQRIDRPSTRKLLVQAREQILAVHRSLVNLREWYSVLWLRENRTYALDRVLDQYDRQLQALTDVGRRLDRVINDFDQGSSLPPPVDIRLAIEETNAWYFRDWLLSGPIQNHAGAGATGIDFLASMGGEKQARPGVAQEFEFEGKRYRWHRHASESIEIVDFGALYEQNQNVAIYAHATLQSEKLERVKALLGSSGGVEVILNGERLFHRTGSRTFSLDEDEVWLPLRVGINQLLLKSTHGIGEWKVSFRLAEKGIRNRKNRYRVSD